MKTRSFLSFVLAIGVVVAATAAAQDNASDTAKLIEVLQLKPGSVVAEIGAGRGDLTVAIAKHVGPSGRVYTSELGEERLRALRDVVTKSGLTNVEVIEGKVAEANLPDGCCDAIFMRNVYHHFGDPTPMNASFLRALKSGGRMAVIDFAPPSETAPAGKRAEGSSHGVSADATARELKVVGFDLISSEERPKRWFIVVAAKPRP